MRSINSSPTLWLKRIAILSLTVLLAGFAHGQYVFERTEVVPTQPLYNTFTPEPDYNLRLGPMDFSVAAGVAAEWNDNVNLAPSNLAEDDIIISPFARIDGIWRLSDLNTLRLAVELGYNYYLNNSQYNTNGVTVAPTSALTFNFLVGDFKVTLSNSFSYLEEPYSIPTISNEAIYRRFTNQAGIQVDYSATEELTVTGGYTHFNLWGTDEEFETLNNSTDTVYLRPAYAISPTIQVGLHGSGSLSRYADDERGDSRNYLLGAFVDMVITEYTRFNVEGGWQRFEADNQLAVGDSTSSNDFYARARITNDLNEYYSHYLGVEHFTAPGFESNFYTSLRITYGFDWRITEYFSLRPQLFYENYDSSGVGSESGDRYGAEIGFGYRLTPSISVSASYRYLTKDSNLPFTDYEQNSVRLSLAYEF